MKNLFSHFYRKIIEEASEDIKHEKFRRKLIEDICDLSKKFSKELTDGGSRVIDEIFNGYFYCKCHIAKIDMVLKSRGLTGASSSFAYVPFEVGLSFDPFLCIPYVPGSSIKGAVRAAWKNLKNDEKFGEEFKDEDKINEDKIFGKGGANGFAGIVIFSDAFPIEPGKDDFILYPDVITPHYSKGGEDIFDETKASPTPIPHLSIAPETLFSFVMAIRRSEDMDKKDAKEIFRKVLKATSVAFKLGIGARTSVGYGIFEIKKLKIASPGD
ncbi:type III-B CRISPR module RAMP protein Cmr6 [Archaeoglobales archaeon]|nr:MAG: type III-B CRISPR module RAMP protein Cmr6 [Archaeoglobales archaeon]